MIGRHFFLWLTGGFVVLTGILSGCDSSLPVAETSPPTVSVSLPLVREIIDQDDYEGRIAAVETVEVRARVRGHLVKVNFQDGQMVKEGDLLFEIDPRPYQASLDAAKAQKAAADASLDLAKKEYARTRQLQPSRFPRIKEDYPCSRTSSSTGRSSPLCCRSSSSLSARWP